MSYIGAEPTTASFPFDQFSGTGSAVNFTLTYAPASTTSIVVSVTGVVQNPNTYTVSGTTLTFSAAPPSGTNNIAVLYLGLPVQIGIPPSGITQQFAAGSASAPSITFIGDTNNGIFAPSADALGITTNGLQRVVVDSSGNMGVGTGSPGAKLHISGSSVASSNIRLTNTFATGRSWEINPYAVGVSDIPFVIRDVTASADRLSIDSNGNVLVVSPAGLGYGTGSGGTVTQATSKNTSVTLNKPTGQITMNNAALAANTTVAFVLGNNLVASTDTITCNFFYDNVINYANYNVWAAPTSGGSVVFYVKNISASSFSEALRINFTVVKGVTS